MEDSGPRGPLMVEMSRNVSLGASTEFESSSVPKFTLSFVSPIEVPRPFFFALRSLVRLPGAVSSKRMGDVALSRAQGGVPGDVALSTQLGRTSRASRRTRGLGVPPSAAEAETEYCEPDGDGALA